MAIKRDRPVPPERRRPLVEAALSPLSRKDTPVGRALAVLRLALAADQKNLELEMERAEAQRRG